jgi:ribosomal protein S12 methylthiotransferase
MVKNKIDIVTLGCSKNLVDSELLMRQLMANGYSVEHDPQNPKGEIVVINTCGFIGDAKEESINTILSFAEAKKRKKLKKIFVMGCLSERYRQELMEEIPEVDRFYGKFDWKKLIVVLFGFEHRKRNAVNPVGQFFFLQVIVKSVFSQNGCICTFIAYSDCL